MKADKILKKQEDANEMHFYQADREWIIEAMKEFAKIHVKAQQKAIIKIYFQ